ncbi:MAG: hypothetical protein G01um101418_387 [Parcubacteria group bacterium Gr01-1014_18]|nr:MAG: hypothetical protein Greene041636_367 [Parcubacteria group bacterium Greene0416_36]TSC81108.1 MAG: hypothetical protein G01um101418_387 [Parcubacteria group bacterium Gr01-1014_18]TSC98476.1 MAG: hypothetical protein Greene101420_713 [Parcubacteria group bacterium Greene1014_20]TSD07359.1 MAG: hypothetical protein Greene07142_214 [Parcubacteria group bacterium Greene0714_2]
MPFSPASIQTFRFVSYTFDESSAALTLVYALDDSIYFEEVWEFPKEGMTGLTPEKKTALDTAFKYLHLTAGTSYYKTACPPKIEIETGAIPKSAADFFNKLYLLGLGEFAYKNKLDLQDRIHFPFDEKIKAQASDLILHKKTAVPVGGGKDSAVTIEILKKAGEPMILFSIGNNPATENTAKISGISKITITRRLSPQLFELNTLGAYNGHIPISSIIAFALAASSVLYDFDASALSNERSANVGNLEYLGMNINHQYTKSLEFEKDANAFFRTHILENFNYFSFLRPLSELHIAKLFAKMEPYHSVFTSCNAAFRIDKTRRTSRWCLDCPKCRFVFLALAPFIEKQKILSIFGANLLADENQIAGFDALLGINDHKPFECVGETIESMAAFILLSEKKDWAEDLIVKNFTKNILPQIQNPEEIITEVLTPSLPHNLSPHFEKILYDTLQSRQ